MASAKPKMTMVGAIIKRWREPIELTVPPTFHLTDVPAKDRQCTDVVGLYILLSFIIVFVLLIIYCVRLSDFDRVKNGVDSCGNVCGERPLKRNGNYPDRLAAEDSDVVCSIDNTNKTYVLYMKSQKLVHDSDEIMKRCVKECPSGYSLVYNKCIPEVGSDVANTILAYTGHEHLFHEVAEDLCAAWFSVICLTLTAIGLSFGALVFVRFFAYCAIWTLLIFSTVMPTAAAVYCWTEWYLNYRQHDVFDRKKLIFNTYIVCGFIATLTAIDTLMVVLWLRKKLALVAALYAEAGRVVRDMPFLLIVPIVTSIVLCVVVVTSLYVSIVVESSGRLTFHKNYFTYEKDWVIHVARWYNIVGMLWIFFLVITLQHVTVAGAVASYYFTRNKAELRSPICRSAYYIGRYHLGSIVIYSSLTAGVIIIRAIVNKFTSKVVNRENRVVQVVYNCACGFCGRAQNKLSFVSRNAYIEMCLHGTNFMTSGRSAYYLIAKYGDNLKAVTSAGDFVLMFAKLFVVATIVIIGIAVYGSYEGLQRTWVFLLLTLITSYVITHSYFSVYETVIDSLLIYFCYDCELNDGVNNPYFMSKHLMSFVGGAKSADAVA